MSFERVVSDLFRNPDRFTEMGAPGETIERARGLGLFSIVLPEELGGMGGGVTPLCEVLSAISGRDSGLATIVATQALAQDILLTAGLGAACTDGLTAFPVFESPVDQTPSVRAEKVQGRWYLTGQLDFVAAGRAAIQTVIPAQASAAGFSYFLVEREAPGLAVSDPIETLGLESSRFADLILRRVPALLIGAESSGPALWENAGARANAAVAAILLGIMKASFREAAAYAEQRVQGGKRIIEWSEHRMMLATMMAQVRTAEILVAQAARAADEGAEGWRQTTLVAALQLQETASELTSNGLQALGGSGYMKDHDQERHFRDAHQLRCILGRLPKRKLGIWTS